MLVTGSLIAVPAHAQDVPDVQDAGPIIDQVLEAYGGSDRLAEVAGYRLEGGCWTACAVGATAAPGRKP
jgi:hypothetical protein